MGGTMTSCSKSNSRHDSHIMEPRLREQSGDSPARRILYTGLAAMALALPLALGTAQPATASTTTSGCTVTPLRPVAQTWIDVNQHIETRIKYSTEIRCPSNRIVKIQDQRYERDDPAGIAGDDYQGQTVATRTFAAGATVTVDAWRRLVELDTEAGSEELYHRARFKVVTIDGTSEWTAYEDSAVLNSPIHL
jgi:hypothetical protein